MADPLATNRTLVWAETRFVRQSRRLGNKKSQIEVLHSLATTIFNLLQNRISSRAEPVELRIVKRIDRRQTRLPDVTNRHRDQSIANRVAHFKGLEAASPKSPAVFFHVDLASRPFQSTHATVGVEKVDTRLVDNDIADFLF